MKVKDLQKMLVNLEPDTHVLSEDGDHYLCDIWLEPGVVEEENEEPISLGLKAGDKYVAVRP